MQQNSINLINFLSTLLISGAMGFINYTFLVNNGVFSVNSEKDDRNKWYIILSFCDFILFKITNIMLEHYVPSSWDIYWDNKIIITIIVTMSVIILLTFLGGFIQIFFYKISNCIRKQLNLSYLTNKSALEEAFDKNNILVYIFDFDHKYITDGYISNFSPSVEFKNQILLQPQMDMSKDDTPTEKYVSKIMDDYYGSTNVYIDTDQKLKYYIIYLP